MKSRSLLFFVSMSFLLPVFGFAASTNSSNVQLDQPVKVAGTQLAPGRYKVTWEGSGPEVQVHFLDGKKVVATAPAKIQEVRNGQDGAIETDSIDNAVVLQAIDLKNMTLRFDGAVPSQGN